MLDGVSLDQLCMFIVATEEGVFPAARMVEQRVSLAEAMSVAAIAQCSAPE